MSERISKTIFSVASVILLSRVLGFVREMVIADRFGTSANYDLYLIAIMLPALAYGVINFASVYIFVPFLSKKVSSDGDINWEEIYPPLNLTLITTVVITMIIIFGAPSIMKIWSKDLTPVEFERVVLYSRITALMVVLGTTEAFMRSLLNVKKIFSYPAGGFIMYNLFCIMTILLFHESLSVGAIAMGLLVGLFVQNLFLFLKVIRFKPLQKFTGRVITPDSKALLTTAGIVIIIELINRSYFLLDRYIALQFGEGVISALNYSQVLVQLPDSIVGFAIGAVVFPLFSESFSRDQQTRFQNVYKKAIQTAVFISVPIAVFFFVHAKEIVYLLFHRGVFDERSVELTATTLQPFTLSIVSLFVISTSIRACYSGGWGRMVLLFTGLVFGVKIAGNILLSDWFGYGGISMATALAHAVFALLMAWYISRKVHFEKQFSFFISLLSMLVAGIASGYGISLLNTIIPKQFLQFEYLTLFIRLASAGLVLLVIYILFVYLFGQKEIVTKLLSKRVKDAENQQNR